VTARSPVTASAVSGQGGVGAEKHALAVLQLMGEPLWDVRRAAPSSVGPDGPGGELIYLGNYLYPEGHVSRLRPRRTYRTLDPGKSRHISSHYVIYWVRV
jgi:hypothetical protein